MSKTSALPLVLVFLTVSCIMVAKPAFSSAAVAEDTWVAKAPMHQARAGLGVAAVNGKIYAIGGSTASGPYPPDCFAGGFVGTNEEYDPETDTWTTKASMPTPRDYFAIAAYQNKIYCIGGAIGFTVDQWGLFHSYVASGVNEVYDTVTSTWETKTPMPVIGMEIQAHVINGKIYVMGVAFTYVYDPENDSWTSKTRMPASPPPSSGSYPVSVVVDDKIVVTGEFSTGLSSSEQKILIYDTETDSWSEGTSGPTIVLNGAAGATTGAYALRRVYVLGLAYGQYPVVPPTNQIYNPNSNTWSTATAMPQLRMDFGVAVLNDILYAIGGYYLNDATHSMVTPNNVNEQYMPVGYGMPDPSYVPPVDNTPPEINILSSANQTYNESSVPFVFTVNEASNWTGYSLDGEENVTVTGNFTLTDLSSGLHHVMVYANDTAGNMGVSETIKFTIALVIHVLSPERRTYDTSSIPLNFTVNSASAQITYCLNGEKNSTVSGNTTLNGLGNGDYALTVYAKDEAGNVGASETILFTVDVPFPTTLVIVSVITVAVVCVGLLVYFKKRKH
jgi:N-acetylneuraminic acid mutarotase